MLTVKDKIQDYTVFLDVLDLVTNGVCITDTEGIILYVNYAFCNACKYSKEELIGQNPRVLKSGLHHDNFYAEMWETLLAGKVWRDAITNKAKDGELYTDRFMIAPIKNHYDGQTMYFACTRYNIDDPDKIMEKLEQIVTKLHANVENQENV